MIGFWCWEICVMVIKIRKKVKEGPKGHYAVPLALPIACLFGPRRDKRDFRRPIEASQRLRSVLAQYLSLEVLVADRPLSLAEFLTLNTSPYYWINHLVIIYFGIITFKKSSIQGH